MKKLAYLLLTCLLMALFSEDAIGQMNRKQIKKNNRQMFKFRGKKTHFPKEKRYDALGISLNAFNYYGDLAPKPSSFSTDIGFTQPAIGLSYTHRFGPRYQLVGSFAYGGIRGSDAESADPGDENNGVFRYVRNLSFRNRIKELSIVAQVDLFENMATYISRVTWTPYAYAGLAVFHHSPQAQAPATDLLGNPLPNAGQWLDLQPLGTEGQNADLQPGDANYGIKSYKRIQFAIPFGIGVRLRVNELIDVGIEYGFRYTFTDYLDDVSGDYVDLTKLDSELARAMSYRSNEVTNPNDNSKLAAILNNRYTYSGYDVVVGFGHANDADKPQNMRGSSGDKDIYTMTTIRLTYIIGKTFHRAKFR